MEEINYKVLVKCITFNHAPYIVDCMNSFTMQKTDFPYICCIIDDASTDGEPDIIRKYIQENFNLEDESVVRIEETNDYVFWLAQHKTNKNCYFAVYLLKYNHYNAKKKKEQYIEEWFKNSKYTALCEGDDYWIDSLKLQKQVDFMECHPNHSLCFCAHRNLYSSGKFRDVLRYDDNNEFCPMEDMILGGGSYMATNSMLFKNSMYESYEVWAKDSPIGDIPIMLTLAVNGHVGYISDVMCVYRVMSSGSWNQRMASDYKKRYIHYRAMLKVFNQFDEYTGYRYHKTVLLKKRKYKKNYVKGLLKSVLSGIRTFLK